MSEPRFDELIHPSTRLSIVALLASADWIDFAFVRDHLRLSDSALSKQFGTLESAGYVTVERRPADRRRRVRVHLTEAGRAAFGHHDALSRPARRHPGTATGLQCPAAARQSAQPPPKVLGRAQGEQP
jgi:DNA-binding MarR family transcriptional regulator